MELRTNRKRLYNMGDLFAMYNLVYAAMSVETALDDAHNESLQEFIEAQNNYLLEVTGVDTLAVVDGYSNGDVAHYFNEDTNLDIVLDDLKTMFPGKVTY